MDARLRALFTAAAQRASRTGSSLGALLELPLRAPRELQLFARELADGAPDVAGVERSGVPNAPGCPCGATEAAPAYGDGGEYQRTAAAALHGRRWPRPPVGRQM